MAEPLRVVDPTTGELVSPGCRSCHEHAAKIAGLEQDVQAVQEENLRLIRANKALKKDRERERQTHKRRVLVEEIVEDWRQTCGKPRCRLSAERFDTIVARLNEGYTAEHFRLAAFGAAYANPWRPKAGQEPMMELATYASKGTWLEQFAKAGAYAQREVGACVRSPAP